MSKLTSIKQPKDETAIPLWSFPTLPNFQVRAHTKGQARAALKEFIAYTTGAKLKDVKLPKGLVCQKVKEDFSVAGATTGRFHETA